VPITAESSGGDRHASGGGAFQTLRLPHFLLLRTRRAAALHVERCGTKPTGSHGSHLNWAAPRFEGFELTLRAGELRKEEVKVRLPEQPF
jgi:hypothetical protein